MFENPVVSPFSSFDLINMITGIYYTDIERYVVMRAREELFGLPEFEVKNIINFKIEELKNYLIQNGYHILYPNDVTFEEASINKNLEINNNNLTKENKHLRHNVSELQKQVNRLTEEKEVISAVIESQQPFIRISDVSWGKVSDIGFIPPSLQPQIQVEDKDYPYISSVPSTVALKVSSDGTTWSRAWEPPINGEIYIETKENDEDLDDV